MPHSDRQFRAPGDFVEPREWGGVAGRAGIAAFAAAFVTWCIEFVPPNMDEFAAFHPLACRYTYSYLHTFREGCNAHPLSLGPLTYHRAYDYIGAASSLVYLPLWAVWRTPASFYVLGVVALTLFSWCLTAALRVPRRYALMAACYFPIGYSLIHDTGPVRFALVSIPLLGVLLQRASRAGSPLRRVMYGVACAAVVIVCVEDKVFYLFVLPLVCGCVVAFLQCEAGERPAWAVVRRAGPAIAALAAVAAAGVWLLLVAAKAGAVPYVDDLRQASGTLVRPLRWELNDLAYFTFLLPMYGNRVFDVGRSVKLASAIFLVPVGFLSYMVWRSRAVPQRVVLCLAAGGVATAVVFVSLRMPSEAHHFVFLHVPLISIVMLAASRSSRVERAAWLAILGSTAAAVALLSATPIQASSGRERARIFEYLSEPSVAAANVINFSSWGGYYQQSLYGDAAQAVTFVDPLTRADAGRLAAIARHTSRNIIDVCMRCDRTSVAAAFGADRVTEHALGLHAWHLFEIRVSPGDVAR